MAIPLYIEMWSILAIRFMQLKELQRQLARKNINSAIIHWTDPNLRYLTQMNAPYAVLEIKPDDIKLHAAGFETERYRKQGLNVKQAKTLNIETGKRTGIIASKTPHKYAQHLAKKTELIDIEQILTKLRQQKTEEELERIRKACKRTDEIYSQIINQEHKTEKDIYKSIMVEIHKRGLEPSFTPIIATSSNAGMPHNDATNTKLKGFTIIDFGVKHKGYCSDMTRTVYYGRPTEKEKAAYDRILKIQEQAIKQAIPGTKLEDIDKWARQSLPKMLHGIGHSIGVEVHDPRQKPLTIKPNMTITIEPAEYTDKYGIRIEDTILAGKETLTKTPKTLTFINRT